VNEPRKPGNEEKAPPEPEVSAVPIDGVDADSAIRQLAAIFFRHFPAGERSTSPRAEPQPSTSIAEPSLPSMEARYRVLVEQIPAVVFMACLDGGLSEAYVSPQIEQMLGFSQEQWLDDPLRWYQRIHPDDRSRWSVEAAELFVTGKPLKSM
jgi:PAS domain-containing protein